MIRPSEDLPEVTLVKKSVCPMPQPEITPRPVTTTRCFSAERAVVVDVVAERMVLENAVTVEVVQIR